MTELNASDTVDEVKNVFSDSIKDLDTYILPVNLESIKDIPRVPFNPFLLDMKVKKKPSYKKMRDVETINEDKHIVLAEENLRDKEPFVRIFHFKSDVLWKLSGNSCRILIYLLCQKLSFNSDFAILNPAELSNILEIKKMTTIYNALIELVEKGVIAGHTEKNVYWINPKIIYFGNRGLIQLKL